MTQTNNTPVKVKPVDELKNQIQGMKPQIKAALPPHIDVDKFSRVVMTAIASNNELVNADRQSFFSSCLKAASDGLLPDNRESALVIFKGKDGRSTVTYMPMISGILKKVRQSGELQSITSQIVYEHDEFEYFIDHEGEHIKHKPDMFADRGKPIGAYALARTKDEGIYFEVMTADQIATVKNSSKSKNFGPWSGPFEDEMWRKTVLRRLSKRLPSSTDIDKVIRRDDELYEFQNEVIATSETKQLESGKGKPSRLKKIIAEKSIEIPASEGPVLEDAAGEIEL